MTKSIFVNLPVRDLPAAMRFYTALGFANNPQFTDSTAACMVWSDAIYVMLLTHEKFAQFTDRRIVDAHRETELLIALNVESRAEVDALLEKALAAGAREPRPAMDHGFMIQRSFADPDGHVWEIFYMDMAAAAAAMQPQA